MRPYKVINSMMLNCVVNTRVGGVDVVLTKLFLRINTATPFEKQYWGNKYWGIIGTLNSTTYYIYTRCIMHVFAFIPIGQMPYVHVLCLIGKRLIKGAPDNTRNIRAFCCLHDQILDISGVANSIIGGGVIFIYSCSSSLISFEINCF